MDKPTKIVTNCSTGVTEIIELTDEEIAVAQAEAAAYAVRQAELDLLAEAKAVAKESAQTKLAALGLTAEEIAAL
jgi:hypothetical protein